MEQKFCTKSKIHCPNKGTHIIKNNLVQNIYELYTKSI